MTFFSVLDFHSAIIDVGELSEVHTVAMWINVQWDKTQSSLVAALLIHKRQAA